MAVHDAVYSSRPETYVQLRWRLLHLAEERLGKMVRGAGSEEDEAAQRLRDMIG